MGFAKPQAAEEKQNMRLRSRTWWIVFGSLLVAGVALSAWLWATDQRLGAMIVNGLFDAAAAVWLGIGLWVWREHPIVRRAGVVVVGTVAAAILVNIFLAFSLDRWVWAVAGVWAMSVGFYVALQAARWLLGLGHPVLGVARTLLDEALSMKAAVALLVLLFVVVPFIPLMLDAESRLSYKLQSFLTYSMVAVTIVLSLLTIVIAVTTITRELDQRQIFLTMTKPVGRGQYVLGKWLGLAVLNLLLVGVSGVGVYTYAKVVADQPAMNLEDVVEAHEQVLTARQIVKPQPDDLKLMEDMFAQRLELLRQQDPATYGRPGDATASLSSAARAAIQQQVVAAWYALRPLDTQTFVFHGLLPAKRHGLVRARAAGTVTSVERDTIVIGATRYPLRGHLPAVRVGQTVADDDVIAHSTVQLRLKPKAAGSPRDDVVYLAMRFNGYDDSVQRRKLADGKFHVVEVPVELIDDAGTLKVELYNPQRPDGGEAQTISFNAADGMSVFYRVASFESNLAGAMLLLWLRLCFLAMLSLAAGTFLGWHVAALLATLVCVAASSSGFLMESIDSYGMSAAAAPTLWEKLLFYPRSVWTLAQQGEGWRAVQVCIGMVGAGFMHLIPNFSKYSGTESLAYGLYLPPSHLGMAVLQVGVLWTGVTGVIAWYVFRRRELARVQV